MPAIVLTDAELAALTALVAQQKEGFETIAVSLAHPFPDLSDYSSDLWEIISRARDGSSHISEDFEDFLNALEAVDEQSKKFAKARKKVAP